MKTVQVKFFVSQRAINADQSGTPQNESLVLQPVDREAGDLTVSGHLSINSRSGLTGIAGGIVTVEISQEDGA